MEIFKSILHNTRFCYITNTLLLPAIAFHSERLFCLITSVCSKDHTIRFLHNGRQITIRFDQMWSSAVSTQYLLWIWKI